MFEIKKDEPYPYDYRETVDVAKKELQEKTVVSLVGKVEDMDQYDVIFLGYPCWCSTMPMPVFTFLQEYNLKDKIILPFCTNEGSGMGVSEKDLRELCPDSDIRKGIPVRGSLALESKPQIEKWLEAVTDND